MKIAKSIKDLIGKTPILEIEKNIFAKCEFLNPLGSIKDRVALNILEEALKKQQIKAGDTIIEATSGNTGIALSAIGASLNLKVVIVMPESMSAERISLMRYFGAEVILTEAKKGMTGAIEKTQEILNSIPNSFLVSQFENPDNPNAHFKTTAVEIWEDFPEIDIFVSAVGTGGTISGVGRFLKSKNPKIKIIGVEPHQIKNHKIQGIGAGFTPKTLDLTIIDEFIKITDEVAFQTARELAKTKGLLVGISSGANIAGSRIIAKKYLSKKILTILNDTGERYISTELF